MLDGPREHRHGLLIQIAALEVQILKPELYSHIKVNEGYAGTVPPPKKAPNQDLTKPIQKMQSDHL